MPEYRKATAFLGRVYPDRIGPTSRSLDGFNSTLIMVDEFSHMVWLENMKVGQELCPVAEHLIYLAETEQINGPRSQVRCIRGDFEFFKNNGLVDVAEQRRIRLENSTPHAHKKGVGETVVGHISRLTRSILANCNPRYWSWAIYHAAFIWNHSRRQDQDVLPPVVRAGLCPSKQCSRILKKYTKIEFGADVFVLQPKRAKKQRFNINSVRAEGMYLGVNLRQRGMIVKIGRRIYIRSNVVAKPNGRNEGQLRLFRAYISVIPRKRASCLGALERITQ